MSLNTTNLTKLKKKKELYDQHSWIICWCIWTTILEISCWIKDMHLSTCILCFPHLLVFVFRNPFGQPWYIATQNVSSFKKTDSFCKKKLRDEHKNVGIICNSVWPYTTWLKITYLFNYSLKAHVKTARPEAGNNWSYHFIKVETQLVAQDMHCDSPPLNTLHFNSHCVFGSLVHNTC